MPRVNPRVGWTIAGALAIIIIGAVLQDMRDLTHLSRQVATHEARLTHLDTAVERLIGFHATHGDSDRRDGARHR